MPHIDSEHISHISYEPGTRVLTVEFHKGGAYQYHGVPINRYTDLQKSASASSYFRQHIKGRYRTEKLKR